MLRQQLINFLEQHIKSQVNLISFFNRLNNPQQDAQREQDIRYIVNSCTAQQEVVECILDVLSDPTFSKDELAALINIFYNNYISQQTNFPIVTARLNRIVFHLDPFPFSSDEISDVVFNPENDVLLSASSIDDVLPIVDSTVLDIESLFGPDFDEAMLRLLSTESKDKDSSLLYYQDANQSVFFPPAAPNASDDPLNQEFDMLANPGY